MNVHFGDTVESKIIGSPRHTSRHDIAYFVSSINILYTLLLFNLRFLYLTQTEHICQPLQHLLCAQFAHKRFP